VRQSRSGVLLILEIDDDAVAAAATGADDDAEEDGTICMRKRCLLAIYND